jgi:endonuclease YncB( thermonuclease family)
MLKYCCSFKLPKLCPPYDIINQIVLHDSEIIRSSVASNYSGPTETAEINTTKEKLKHIVDDKEVPYFSFNGLTFYAMPCHIYDGDTFSVIFEYKGELIKYRCRCTGYDCAEMKPSKSDPNREHEKELAHKAKDRLIELLGKHPSKLIKIECGEFDKYGRLLITFYNNIDNKSINQIMIDEGHGKPYEGGTKEKWV